MRSTRAFALSKSVVPFAVCFTLVFAVFASTERVHFAPHFSVGETLRYRIESRSTSAGSTTTPIVNPEGGSKASQAIHLIVRLDVLDSAGLPSGAVNLRATYEKSAAESETDAFNPDAASFGDQYARLEGRSIEFTMEPGGQLSNVKGLEDIFSDRSAAEPVLSWLQGIPSGPALPQDGIAIGQKWKSERPLAGSPLSGVVWRTESTYLRNEPCPSSASAPAPGESSAKGGELCAVILTRFTISRSGASNETPDDFRRNGLRTSGSWTGSGQSLDLISLATNLLVSSTQTSIQDMDYQITSASTGSAIRHKGHVESDSEIALLPPQK